MDPISAGASAFALVGATVKVVKGIRRLKALQDEPRELDDLLVETSQPEPVLHAVHNAYENSGPELRILFEAARGILVDLDSLIEYRPTEARSSHKVDRWQWTLKLKDVKRLRGKLKDVTANLVALFGVKIRYIYPPLLLYCAFMKSGSSTTLSPHGSTAIHQVYQFTTQALSEQRQLSNQLLPAISLLVKHLEGSPSTRAALTGSFGGIRQLNLQATHQEKNTVASMTESKAIRADQNQLGPNSQTGFYAQESQKPGICEANCACRCHFPRHLGMPGLFRKLSAVATYK